MKQKKAIVIGGGFGGLSLAIRLESMGFQTTLLEKLDKLGGRAYQKIESVKGVGDFIFDMGPTVLTVPHFIEELFSLEKGSKFSADYPKSSLDQYQDVKVGKAQALNTKFSPTFSLTEKTRKYVKIVPIKPFYRIHFSDNTFFDYGGEWESTIKQIRKLTNEAEVEGYKKFFKAANKVFEKGFLDLGYTHFSSLGSMLKVIPTMLKLDVVRSLDSYAKKYFKHPKTRFIFSFETLLVGGNPKSVPALYAMIHLVETTWRIHYAIGGTGKLIEGFSKKFEELGGLINLNSEVLEILVKDKKAIGVKLRNNQEIFADIVSSNADYGYTYSKLIKTKKIINSDFRTKKLTQYSNSLFVLYFAFKAEKDNHDIQNLKHHNIILGEDLDFELDNIYQKGDLTQNFSQYLHIPTLTDKSLAPEGYHTAYTLVVVPNKKMGKQNWSIESEILVDRIIQLLDTEFYIPNLKKRLVHKSYISPDYFENKLNSFYGNAFGPSPIFRQSAYFRPHNKSKEIKNLYCVGASYQPGGGTPSVMMSAKMTARLIAQDFQIKV